jgi:hypothetical protein
MPVDLLPCPFCGGDEIAIEESYYEAGGDCAFCVKCGVMLEKKKWNQRAESEAVKTSHNNRYTKCLCDYVPLPFSNEWDVVNNKNKQKCPIHGTSHS